MSDYYKNTAINQSSIKAFIEDPEKFWRHSPRNIDCEPSKQTDAMAKGSLYHAIIESRIMDSQDPLQEYFVTSLNRKGTKKWKSLQEEKPDKILVKQTLYDECSAAVDVLVENSHFKEVVKSSNKVEQEIYWFENIDTDHARYVTDCKAKIDLYNYEYIVDWKSTRAETDDEFEIAINQYKYYLQGAWYARAIMELLWGELNELKVVIIAQNIKKPEIIFYHEFDPKQIENIDYDIMNVQLPKMNEFIEYKQRQRRLIGYGNENTNVKNVPW